VPGASTDRPWSAPPERSGPTAQLHELRELVVGYAKQETVDPLRTLGRSLGYGIAGSIMLGLGLTLLLLALLRGLQQIELFNDPLTLDGGTWSWAPYLITLVVGLVLIAVFVWRLMRFVSSRSEATPTNPGGTR
jgi:hypothetical protein